MGWGGVGWGASTWQRWNWRWVSFIVVGGICVNVTLSHQYFSKFPLPSYQLPLPQGTFICGREATPYCSNGDNLNNFFQRYLLQQSLNIPELNALHVVYAYPSLSTYHRYAKVAGSPKFALKCKSASLQIC